MVQLGLVVVALALAGRLAARYGLSPVPLYLLGGLAFGTGGLAPVTAAEDFIRVGAEIGVLLLLLMLGLEYTPTELTSGLKRQAPAGLLDFVLNAAPGVAVGLVLGWELPAVVALGGITWISSSGIIAKVLADLGRLGNRETPAILSILVIEDLAMAVYLPLLTVLLAGQGLSDGARSLTIALTALTVTLVVALRFGERLTRIVAAPTPEPLLLGVLGTTLLVAGLAQAAQVSAGVGAFLVGIALSGPAVETARPLLEPLRDLFAAVFFVFFGLQTDPAALPAALVPALVLVVLTSATKVATGWYAAARLGVRTPGRVRAGLALIARGEFSIVIAGLAVASGVEPGIGPLATAYVLLMAVLGPLAARAADPLAARLVRAT